MALLDDAEAAAVIGHELGHFTGEDTQYSLRFVPLYAGMQNSLEQMANSSQGFSGLTASYCARRWIWGYGFADLP